MIDVGSIGLFGFLSDSPLLFGAWVHKLLISVLNYFCDVQKHHILMRISVGHGCEIVNYFTSPGKVCFDALGL